MSFSSFKWCRLLAYIIFNFKRRTIMKKIFSAITATILLLSMCTIAYASENTEKAADSLYSMRYTYISYTTTSINISNGLATVSNSISCNSDVDKVTVSSYLQKYSNGTWTTLKHWTDTEMTTDMLGHTHTMFQAVIATECLHIFTPMMAHK